MADVHVCAVAARTPVGLNAETSAAAIRARLASISEHPTLVDPFGEPIMGGLDARLDPDLRGRKRMLELGRAALTELLTKIGGNSRVMESAMVLLALPEPRPGWSPTDPQVLAQQLSETEHVACGTLSVHTYAGGHAGGLYCLGEAANQVTTGTAEFVIVGGVDSYLETQTLGWLHAQGLLRQTSRGGLLPGESAAFLALASSRVVSALGLPSLATVTGWSSVSSTPLLQPPAPSEQGRALAQVICATLDALSDSHTIDDVYCDINGQRERSEEWGFAALRVPPRFRDPTAYISPADLCGDLGAASGPLLSVLAARAFVRGYARGPNALVWSSSFGGTRGAVLLQASTAEEAAFG